MNDPLRKKVEARLAELLNYSKPGGTGAGGVVAVRREELEAVLKMMDDEVAEGSGEYLTVIDDGVSIYGRRQIAESCAVKIALADPYCNDQRVVFVCRVVKALRAAAPTVEEVEPRRG